MNAWYDYVTLEGERRSVKRSEIAVVRQDFWRHRDGGGSDEWVKLVSRTGAVLARVPKGYARVMQELGRDR